MKIAKRAKAEPPSVHQVAVVTSQLEATTGVELNFADAYRQWHDIAMDHALWLLEDYDSACDAVGDTALRFFRRWQELPLEQKTIGTFIAAVHNRAIDVIRRLEMHVELTEEVAERLALSADAPFPPVDQVTGDIDIEPLLKQALDQLPQQAKAVFQLRRLQHMGREETAAALGIAVKTVSNDLGRADALVRAALIRAGVRIADGTITQLLPAQIREGHHE